MSKERELLNGLIHRSGELLDAGDFDGYIALYSEQGEYRLETIEKGVAGKMTWIALDKGQLAALLASVPQHLWNTGERSHLVTVDSIDFRDACAATRATFCVFRTDELGRSETYAIGRYEDDWIREPGGWKLRKRVAALKTRVLTPQSAVPL